MNMAPKEDSGPRRPTAKRFAFRRFWAVGVIAWALIALAGMYGLHEAKTWATARLADPAEQRSWDAWREEAARQSEGKGPVRRRMPKSAQPPSVVLLRDHYRLCQTAVVLFSGILTFTFCFLVLGAFGQGEFRPTPDQPGFFPPEAPADHNRA